MPVAEARLAAFTVPDAARAIWSSIESNLNEPGVEHTTAHFGRRLVEKERCGYLRPTVIHCDSSEATLANTEFMFPFASILQVPQERMIETIGESLVVSAFTHDRDWTIDLMTSTNIERLNIGPYPTTRVQWEQPHEGNLFEFLYRRRALQGDVVAAGSDR